MGVLRHFKYGYRRGTFKLNLTSNYAILNMATGAPVLNKT